MKYFLQLAFMLVVVVTVSYLTSHIILSEDVVLHPDNYNPNFGITYVGLLLGVCPMLLTLGTSVLVFREETPSGGQVFTILGLIFLSGLLPITMACMLYPPKDPAIMPMVAILSVLLIYGTLQAQLHDYRYALSEANRRST